MYAVEVRTVSEYANHGMACEQNLAYTLTGEMRKHDHIAFDKGSDIPEYEMSVKSARFTLVSAKLMTATTKEAQIREYFERTASKQWAYVSYENIAYIMDRAEFETFLNLFTTISRESGKNGGGLKLKACHEKVDMMKWLHSHIN